MNPEDTASLMRRFRSRDTKPEVLVRRALHAMGMRFRVHIPIYAAPRRTIDVAFPRARVAVFVDGCYWHACPEHGKVPATNSEWWATKLERNQERDRETNALLEADGWLVLRFWEHEDPILAAERIAQTVRGR